MIRIQPTNFFHPKSEDSIGDIEIDDEIVAIFREYRATVNGFSQLSGLRVRVTSMPFAPPMDTVVPHVISIFANCWQFRMNGGPRIRRNCLRQISPIAKS